MDLVWKRTAAKDVFRVGASRGWWRPNIKNPYSYAKSLARQVKDAEGRKMSPSRLKAGIEEDSHLKISIADCRAIMRKAKLL